MSLPPYNDLLIYKAKDGLRLRAQKSADGRHYRVEYMQGHYDVRHELPAVLFTQLFEVDMDIPITASPSDPSFVGHHAQEVIGDHAKSLNEPHAIPISMSDEDAATYGQFVALIAERRGWAQDVKDCAEVCKVKNQSLYKAITEKEAAEEMLCAADRALKEFAENLLSA